MANCQALQVSAFLPLPFILHGVMPVSFSYLNTLQSPRPGLSRMLSYPSRLCGMI